MFNYIKFTACDFAETPLTEAAVSEKPAAVFFNPEYGIRLGDPEELKRLYDRIGQFLADKCRGMTGAMITGNPALAREVNLKYRYRVPFYNGPIDCRLFVYDLNGAQEG